MSMAISPLAEKPEPILFEETCPQHIRYLVSKVYKKAVSQLPMIDLQGRMGVEDRIDFLQPSDLPMPMDTDPGTVRYRDKYGRKGIAFLVKEDRGFAGIERIAVALFERYQNDPDWAIGISDQQRQFQAIKDIAQAWSEKRYVCATRLLSENLNPGRFESKKDR